MSRVEFDWMLALPVGLRFSVKLTSFMIGKFGLLLDTAARIAQDGINIPRSTTSFTGDMA
jgi:hypothetical protein